MTTTLEERLDTTFAALSNSTRRAIYGPSRPAGEATVDLARRSRSSSRCPRCQKHLKVLEEAGLIQRARRAQFRPCVLDPEALEAAVGWAAACRETWDARLERLEAHVAQPPRRSGPPMTQDTDNAVRLTRTFEASRETLWNAWTDPAEFGAWYGPDGASVDVLRSSSCGLAGDAS